MMPCLTRASADSLRLASAIPFFSVTAHGFVASGGVVHRRDVLAVVFVRRLRVPRLTRASTDSLCLASAVISFSVTAHSFVARDLRQRIAVLPSCVRIRRVAPNTTPITIWVSTIVVSPRVVRRPGFVVAVCVRKLKAPRLTRASTDSLVLASAVISPQVPAHGFITHRSHRRHHPTRHRDHQRDDRADADADADADAARARRSMRFNNSYPRPLFRAANASGIGIGIGIHARRSSSLDARVRSHERRARVRHIYLRHFVRRSRRRIRRARAPNSDDESRKRLREKCAKYLSFESIRPRDDSSVRPSVRRSRRRCTEKTNAKNIYLHSMPKILHIRFNEPNDDRRAESMQLQRLNPYGFER